MTLQKAFARNADRGWNLLSYASCDMTGSGMPNMNLAQAKMGRALHNHQVTYGTADGINDGNRQSNYALTGGANMADGLRIDIDLKKVRSIRKIVIWQPPSDHFKMNLMTIMYSTDETGSTWSMYKENAKAELFQPGGLALKFTLNIRMRWVRFILRQQAGYYWGIGKCAL